MMSFLAQHATSIAAHCDYYTSVRLQVVRLWPNHTGSDQSVSYGCDHSEKWPLKTTMTSPKEVSEDAGIASVISELVSISSLKDHKNGTEGFSRWKMCALLLHHMDCWSDWLILIEGDRQMVRPITCQGKYFLKQPALLQTVSKSDFTDDSL